MQDIVSLLRQKEEQLKLLTRQVEALRVAAELMVEEQKLVGSPAADSGPTQPEMIRAVIGENGKPMHLSKIAEAIRKKYNKRFKRLYLTSIIYRQMKKGKMFYRAAPSTFGLIEWQVGKTIPMPLEVNVASRM